MRLGNSVEIVGDAVVEELAPKKQMVTHVQLEEPLAPDAPITPEVMEKATVTHAERLVDPWTGKPIKKGIPGWVWLAGAGTVAFLALRG